MLAIQRYVCSSMHPCPGNWVAIGQVHESNVFTVE